jgi:hypothetical protein
MANSDKTTPSLADRSATNHDLQDMVDNGHTYARPYVRQLESLLTFEDCFRVKGVPILLEKRLTKREAADFHYKLNPGSPLL